MKYSTNIFFIIHYQKLLIDLEIAKDIVPDIVVAGSSDVVDDFGSTGRTRHSVKEKRYNILTYGLLEVLIP